MLDWFRRAPRTALATLALVAIAGSALGQPTPIQAQVPAVAPTPAPAGSPGVPVPAPLVVAVNIEGNAHIPTDRIFGVISTRVGKPFDARVVESDLRAIGELGFFADQAPPVITQRPDGVAITFRVVENPVVTRITFSGNKVVPTDTLLALMDTAQGQVFNLRTYQQDVLKINSYYDKIGFGGQLPSHVADVNISPQGVVALSIREGLTVRHIVIVGAPQADPILAPTTIIRSLVTKEGSPYSDDLRDKDIEKLKDLYKKFELTIGDFESGIDPSTIDIKSGTADVRYSISVARVGAIEIVGNTKTSDEVIRRQLRLHPGMLITDTAIRNDYNRINNLGFFDKVDVSTNPGPDPKRPANMTVKWTVKEQRTGTAQIGAGYSGGLTGTGLTGNLGYSENNINGTGDSGSVRFERGSRVTDSSLSFSIPYLGNTEASQKYSLAATVFSQSQTNYYPVYLNTPAPAPGVTATPIPLDGTVPVPVSIVPTNPTSYNLISTIAATYQSAATGISVTLGRRWSDFFSSSFGVNLAKVQANATVPSPYYFPTNTSTLISPLAAATSNPLTSSNASPSDALGIIAPSLAQINSSNPYSLRSVTLGLGTDTRDDFTNPRRGYTVSLGDEYSSSAFGSAFDYSIYTLDASRFFTVFHSATLGIHARIGDTTGAIPTNKLYTFSDQQLRGYSNPYYGTDMRLFQAELRIPLTSDRKIAIVPFVDDGAMRIRGGQQIDQTTSTVTDLSTYVYHADVGLGIRFDVPQLGLKTIRLDFAHGSLGSHTSFGIGQSF